MRPVFADPKTDFVFKRIFGSEIHKPVLIELLNALLELSGDHRIVDLKYLSSEQHVPVEELKMSLVDVKCFDERGRHYVVEMQVLNVEGFEKRVVYNTSKAYVTQLRTGEDYPGLDDVPPFREAMEVARMAGFSAEELDLYDRAKIAEQDARGALSLAERQGREAGLAKGREEGLAKGLLAVLRARGIAVPDALREHILAQKDAERLERWLEKAAVAASIAEVIDETS